SGRTGGRMAAARLVLVGGQVVTLHLALSNYDARMDAVRRGVTAARLPAAQRELAEGEVKFGPLGLTPRGLNAGRKELGWEEIDRVWVGNGCVGWRSKRGQDASCPLQDIPNYDVLLALIRAQVGNRCEAPSFPEGGGATVGR